MKLHDFDAKFYDYVRVQMAMMPALKEDEVEEKYNQMMQSWLNAPATWLDGVKPVDYFKRYDAPKDLMKLLEGYLTRDIGLPEPLYARIVEIGEPCAEALTRFAGDRDRPAALRSTAIALLRDIGSEKPADLYIELVCRAKDGDDLAELACDALKDMDIDLSEKLLSRYDGATTFGRMMLLEVLVKQGKGDRVYDILVDGLRRDAERRGLYAGLLADMGDERAVEPLKEAAALSDLRYLDYLEIRDAIESLGGDPGQPREFNGDPDYETMRNM